jgi:hypothetical protein
MDPNQAALAEHLQAHRDARRQMDDDRELVLDAVSEAYNDFVFYNRKLDDTLPPGKLYRLIREGVVTKAEIVAEFKRLIDTLDENSL